MRNYPLPDGNKRVAYSCLRTFLDMNGYDLRRDPSDDADEDVIVSMFFDLAAGALSERAFEEWLRDRIVRSSLGEQR